MPVNLTPLNEHLKKALEHVKTELGRLRTGRAHAGLLEGIRVDYYGSMVPIQQIGNVSVPEPRCIVIQVYDASAVEALEKAIQQSDLGLNPSHEGNLVRVNIPALTEERRKDLVKKAGKLAEETKVAMRTHRRDMNEAVKKQKDDKAISEDEMRKGQDEVQKITDKFTKEIEAMLVAKEKEIMTV